METISNQFHSRDNIFLAISRLFERASYYGVRALFVLYMTSEVLQMGTSESLKIYGLFTSGYYLSKVIGACVGDLIIGNRKAIYIGGVLHVLGTFTFIVPSIYALYLGITFIGIGLGMVAPNLDATFGKSYLNKTKLLDAGFTIHYLAVNVGAFVGILVCGYVGEIFGWHFGFLIGGIYMMISLLFVFLANSSFELKEEKKQLVFNKNVIKVIVAIIAVTTFWVTYDLISPRLNELVLGLKDFAFFNIPPPMFISLGAYMILPACIILIIFWTKFYYSQIFKLAVGFIFAAASFGVLWFIPEVVSEQHIYLYLTSLVLIVIAEAHLGPIVLSVITKNANPKYLAIIMSLAFLPQQAIIGQLVFLPDAFFSDSSFVVLLCTFIMFVAGVAMLIFFSISNDRNTIRSSDILDDI